MKKFVLAFLCFTMIFTSGYRFHLLKKNRPLILFNARPITNATVNETTRYFGSGRKIHFIVIVPQGFKDDYIRVQVVKKEQKTEHWGYKIYWAKDYCVERGEKYFISYIVIDEPGYYFLQVFDFKDFDWPLARNDFWVQG